MSMTERGREHEKEVGGELAEQRDLNYSAEMRRGKGNGRLSIAHPIVKAALTSAVVNLPKVRPPEQARTSKSNSGQLGNPTKSSESKSALKPCPSCVPKDKRPPLHYVHDAIMYVLNS